MCEQIGRLTPMHFAAANGHLEIVRSLLDRGVPAQLNGSVLLFVFVCFLALLVCVSVCFLVLCLFSCLFVFLLACLSVFCVFLFVCLFIPVFVTSSTHLDSR